MNSDVKNHTVGIVLYSGFELLDVFGPAEMFGVVSMLPGLEGAFELVMVAERGRECVSAQAPRVLVDAAFADDSLYDILLVPAGMVLGRM